MHITKRSLILLIPTVLPIALYTVTPQLIYVGGAYLVSLIIVCIIDYATNPVFKGIEINREINAKFSLGLENVCTLQINNRPRHQVRYN